MKDNKVFTSEDVVYEAFKIVEKAFLDKKDKGGNPYVGHLLDVEGIILKSFSFDHRLRTIALLHDLLEDCPEWTEELLREKFSREIVDAVVVLTKKKGQSYSEYIKGVKSNKLAVIVKMADLESNMNITRLTELTEKDLERLKKYHKSFFELKKCL